MVVGRLSGHFLHLYIRYMVIKIALFLASENYDVLRREYKTNVLRKSH